IMVPGQSLSDLTARAIIELQYHLEILKENDKYPEYILAQGDTNTVLASAIVSFYNNIKFAHLEAGLRTWDLENPFPEEYNRKVASISAHVNFAPTEISRKHLVTEGIESDKILQVGNTIVDALNIINKKIKNNSNKFNLSSELRDLKEKNNLVLITCHRRENHGKNLLNVIKSVIKLSGLYPKFQFVWIMHPNPNVKQIVADSIMSGISNISLIDPVDYIEMVQLFQSTRLMITDSGGLQEEAPSFGIPVLVIGKKTERIESVLLNYSYLTGTDEREIITSFAKHLDNKFEITENPYGDGKASERVVDYFEEKFSERI
ncbi:MAG: UDP-N-acetylglucosamine 2-epimerase (non-hydrolyzing), partial [Bacteroidota bacterium]|nr:UDP-N-acetylglucosamine 2-epimerase (non-hydrolyzing) [Bacteroidota bacterium]